MGVVRLHAPPHPSYKQNHAVPPYTESADEGMGDGSFLSNVENWLLWEGWLLWEN